MNNHQSFIYTISRYAWLLVLPLLLSGCITIKNSKKEVKLPDGFVFVSEDKGVTWQQAVKLVRPGPVVESLANTAVTALLIDPTDDNAWYAGTPDRGLLYSFSMGKDWQVTLENIGAITTVAVDPLNHCFIYAAVGPAVYKSTDCTRNWQKIIVAGAPANNKVSTLLIDTKTAGKVYAGTSNSELWRSDNYGDTWTMIHKFNSAITKILMNPNDNKIVYITTADRGLWRFKDSLANWEDITPRAIDTEGKKGKIIRGANIIRDLAIDYTVRDGLWYASDAGLHYTDDGGVTWRSVNLPVTLSSKVQLGRLEADRQNRSNLFLSVGSRLAVTNDNGATWSWRELPSQRSLVELTQLPGSQLLISGFGPGAKK